MIERNELLGKRILPEHVLSADKILRIQLVIYIFRICMEEYYKINMTFIGEMKKKLHKKIIKTRLGNSFQRKFSIYFCLDILFE